MRNCTELSLPSFPSASLPSPHTSISLREKPHAELYVSEKVITVTVTVSIASTIPEATSAVGLGRNTAAGSSSPAQEFPSHSSSSSATSWIQAQYTQSLSWTTFVATPCQSNNISSWSSASFDSPATPLVGATPTAYTTYTNASTLPSVTTGVNSTSASPSSSMSVTSTMNPSSTSSFFTPMGPSQTGSGVAAKDFGKTDKMVVGIVAGASILIPAIVAIWWARRRASRRRDKLGRSRSGSGETFLIAVSAEADSRCRRLRRLRFHGLQQV